MLYWLKSDYSFFLVLFLRSLISAMFSAASSSSSKGGMLADISSSSSKGGMLADILHHLFFLLITLRIFLYILLIL